MSRISISVGTLMVLSAAMVVSGQSEDPSTPIQPAPVKNSSAPAKNSPRLAPKQAKGQPRSAAASERKASVPQVATGVSPQVPLMVNGRLTVTSPPTKQDVTRTQLDFAEELRYQGTTAVPYRMLDPKDERLKTICTILSEADFVPEERIRTFSSLRPRYAIFGWKLTVCQLEERQDGTLVRVWAAPLLKARGEGTTGVMAFYGESYRIAGGRLEFLGGDPITAVSPVMMGGSQ
jgi:hypothetical protein